MSRKSIILLFAVYFSIKNLETVNARIIMVKRIHAFIIQINHLKPIGVETSGSVQTRTRTRVWVQKVNVTRVRVRVQKSWTRPSLKEMKRLSDLDQVGLVPGTGRVRVRVQNISINRVRVQKGWTRWSLHWSH